MCDEWVRSAVLFTNVPVSMIYGAPVAASKTDKNGNATPSAVKVTVTTTGRFPRTYQINAPVDPLPERVRGAILRQV